MAILTSGELAALRRAVGDGVVPVTWDKPTINMATQGVEDVLEGLAFDATTFVSVVTTTDARAETVKDDLDGNRIPLTLRPVVEDWIAENPLSISVRSVNESEITNFITLHRAALIAAVVGMPPDRKAQTVLAVIKRRVEAVV